MSKNESKYIDRPLAKVILSYPSLFEKTSFGESEPAYRANFILDPENRDHAKLIKGLKADIKRLKERDFGSPKAKIKEDHLFLKEGDPAKPEQDGKYIIKASSKKNVHVVDRKRQPIIAEDDVIYSGCVVNAQITLGTYDAQIKDKETGKGMRIQGIKAYLNGVQFWADGDRLDGLKGVEDMFEAYEDEDEDDEYEDDDEDDDEEEDDE